MKSSRDLLIITRMAWRNLWKNKRRTILTLLLIMVGTGTIIVMRAFQIGGYSQMIYDSVSNGPAHMQIQDKAHWEKQVTSKAFLTDDAFFNKLAANKDIKAFGRRVYSSGAIWKGDEEVVEDFSGAQIMAIEPVPEKDITYFSLKIIKGRYFTNSDSKHLLIGKKLADTMKIKVGDVLAMQAMGYQTSASGRYTVIGIFQTGSPLQDRLVIMPFAEGMRSFGMKGHISTIAIKLNDPDKVADVEKYLKDDLARLEKINKDEIAQLAKADKMALPKEFQDMEEDVDNLSSTEKDIAGANMKDSGISTDETQINKTDDGTIIVLGWEKLIPEILQMIVMDRISGNIFVFVLYMVVAFGIINTIQMSIYERIREFGVMLAIGTRPLQITSMVLVETAYITIIGVLLGILLGGAVSTYFHFNPIDYSQYAKEMELWGMTTTTMGAILKIENVIRTSLITMFVAVFFAAFPAFKASRIKPVDAIRHL